LKLDPELAEAHASRGIALTYQRLFDDAADEFERAMELDSVLYEAPYYYGRSLQARGNMAKAAEFYERAAALRIDDYQAPLFAATAYRALGRDTEADAAGKRGIAAVERALALNPNDSRGLYLGAIELQYQGVTSVSEEWARRAVQSDPLNPLLLYNIGCLYAVAGKAGLALDHLERAMELGMRNRDWLMTDPDLNSLRDDSRFKALLSGAGETS
jgi:adenylate cyclase